ncbi:unnamed protein product [Nyctereutes procyonoides]|uniref:(raccoon dog) hypothetical protein n=1 Tax=Nyctereutes procyonoides TaxID=34880 RepID=A0A811ZIV7_NYCPR|nr:unnamed protein product [Nyctereutes procyonoides]
MWQKGDIWVSLIYGKKGEHMIQKNPFLFTNIPCKVCCALLISESQKLAHYQMLKGETKKLDSDQKTSRSKHKNQGCPICNSAFSSPGIAQLHYLGKTHSKNLKLYLCRVIFNHPVVSPQRYVGKKIGNRKPSSNPRHMMGSWQTARFQCKGSPFRKTQPPWKTRGVSVQHLGLNQLLPMSMGCPWLPLPPFLYLENS